jgi:hypothetical protein
MNSILNMKNYGAKILEYHTHVWANAGGLNDPAYLPLKKGHGCTVFDTTGIISQF